MDANSLPPWHLAVLVISIAFLYASVGFGGASGYLVAMSLFAIPPQVMASTALMLNILVSSIAFIAYYRARHFTPRLLWPFLLTSIPAAFLGGYIHIGADTYLILLYLSLSYVTFRMLFYHNPKGSGEEELRPFPLAAALAAGGVIGLFSGIIGIGGGLFLSPLIVLTGWGTPKQAAASAAAFIFVNSISGLTGRLIGGSLELGTLGLILLPVGLVGALGGSQLGARYLSSSGLRRVLGVTLLIAVSRFWLGFR
ncbi:MAG: sulfite exporter TauE/SafE family protein [Anaerolineales bacterium]